MRLTKNYFFKFIIVFALVFLICYYGAMFFTGLAVPGGIYSPFMEKYFNVANWLRSSLIFATKFVVSIFGITTVRTSEYILRIPNANGIKIVYSCLGFGVMSFWAAYVIATISSLKAKIIWLLSGLLLIWIINVCRISMVLLANNKGWKFPFAWNHHTWFNIIAYIAIFTMMYFFEKHLKQPNPNGS